MEIVFVVVIALLGAAFVALPLRHRAPISPAGGALDELNERRRSALEALVDLENENAVGKLSDEDLAELRPRYEAEALAVLDELAALDAGAGDDAVEAEIASMRARLERER